MCCEPGGFRRARAGGAPAPPPRRPSGRTRPLSTSILLLLILVSLLSSIKFLKSRRGKIIMMVNTFPFCEESKLRDKVIWRCTSKKTNCKARIHMLGSSVVAVKGMHNHPPRALCLPARRAPRKGDASAPVPAPAPVAAAAPVLDAAAPRGPEHDLD
ncbi:hypothetical protein EVAR_17968_1 [Eumeta japonica]|uniref:FLYWCH-type domain-containing protein n=1 Tax=Eumeta variegata TaxID=151549 RepID=A0A4C1UZN7_EUMVA|nr:hypothetical protein EVAR_17968_1 [Eumeta japonica]